MMELLLIRHGETEANERHAYAGTTDLPLTALGEEHARALGCLPSVERVFVSPLKRARQTASICFPNAEQVVVDDLAEVDFGRFENHTYEELSDDPEYITWVEGHCMGQIPGGETAEGFIERASSAVASILAKCHAEGCTRAVIVAHGGTAMATLYAFSEEDKGYFDWHIANCEGYRCNVEWIDTSPLLTNCQPFAELDFLE